MSVSEMGSVCGESIQGEEAQGSNAQEEKIFVSVRLRPLNERELSKNDVSDWECVNNSTILYKNILQERSMFPTAYSFDRVFGCESSTRQVYDEAAKSVAFSVVNGINSSIFAYGQTSSGKTYTMTGVTEYAISDIYEYINKHEDREFVLKFSALEIYNECVRDLLSSENMQLRLLDDPERGTVVEKLTEVTLRDFDHLKELLSICEAQRQIGETSLNEMSSRSHQILRLTVESSARKLLGSQNSSTLAATVDFVDLAGSERASQALTASARLKEGCHINRSLLTLGTVIRKLSKGRNGHVPYRDSKLTRILQNSLGGNARTAIICTVSPAHIHLEQSRNTLLFASCAKQVSTNAQVNVVMSEKELVKKLQRELARLENELRMLGSLSGSCDSASALKEKELLIEKMDKEIRELTQQRDLAQSRLQDMQHAGGEYEHSRSWAELSSLSDLHEKGPWIDDYPRSEISEIVDPLRSDVTSNISPFSDRYEVRDSNKVDIQFPEAEDQFLSDDTSPTAFIDKYFGPDPSRGWEKMARTTDQNVEDICKEVRCIEIGVDNNTVSAQMVSSQKECQDFGQIVADDSTGTRKQTAQDLKETNSTRTRKRTAQDMKETNSTAPRKQTARDLKETNSTGTLKQTAQDLKETNSTGTLKKTAQDLKEANSTGTLKKTAQDLKEANSTGTLKQTDQDLKENSDCLIDNHPVEHYSSSSDTDTSDSKVIDISRRPIVRTASLPPGPEMTLVNENIPSGGIEKEISGKFKGDEPKVTELYCAEKQLDEKEDKSKISTENDTDSQHMFATELHEDNQPKRQEQLEHDKVLEVQQNSKKLEDLSEDALKPTDNPQQSPSEDGLKSIDHPQQFTSDWSEEFERQRREIIELWDACNITLVHRTYFFLLFKGEQSDSIYMEVELRQLSYLKSTLSRGSSVGKSDAILTHASNARALNRERKMLSKQILKKFSSKEREALFQKWGIGLKTKQRRLQLCRRLWTDTKDMEHIKESAALVAKLVGIVEPSRAPKEIFGLSLPPSPSFRSYSWKPSLT